MIGNLCHTATNAPFWKAGPIDKTQHKEARECSSGEVYKIKFQEWVGYVNKDVLENHGFHDGEVDLSEFYSVTGSARPTP